MTELVLLLLVFVGTGVGFLLVNLLVGKLIRPNKPGGEKGTVYECGEPPVGSWWVQFDVGLYVVALLLVIFDVVMAFFFPWATVFGGANRLTDDRVPMEERAAIQQSMTGQAVEVGISPDVGAANTLAWLAFIDILIFFGVLLVGFAYLWKRGDLEWIRSTAGQKEPEPVAAEGGG